MKARNMQPQHIMEVGISDCKLALKSALALRAFAKSSDLQLQFRLTNGEREAKFQCLKWVDFGGENPSDSADWTKHFLSKSLVVN